ncbi:ABC transporter substrate-binding protein [Listeria ivanovii]|uniref:ABC transporter substrate-binding protein n=1 Tax=Listeria ivanovii TaxID=1638 RepID=UPI0003EC9459|nr:extracellular solute-binding protein [Listeria ivanovii]AHI55022.1 ABC transporter substrate-binding protein [Listeria ivanovii WSLC3009]AIS64480.1 ABC transporter substrate-binding protein [Listeria ivanovii subsp. ivanovii]QDA72985.1 extracellular solute-binding protein [Listeria ivanovii]SNV36873.1 P39 [Listeria ivanovii subsp. ivanovii]SNV83157.1 P39 [Listeria ivanovii subsp. ivanovii]
MKKIVSISCIVAVLMLLASCGSGESSSSKVEFYTDKGGENVGILNSMSEQIEKDGGVGYKTVGYTEVTSYETTVQQSLDSEKAPGLFTWWSGDKLKKLVDNDLVVDLTKEWKEYYEKEGVNPGLADAFTIDGKVYAAPFSVLYNGILYNKHLFDKYDLEVPTTWDEFIKVCDTLKANKIEPIGLKNDPWASFLWFQTLIASYAPDLYVGLTNGDIKYTDPEMKKVMKIWQKMITKGYFGDPVDPASQIKMFSTDKSAMVYEPTVTSATLKKEYNMEPGKDFDVFVAPSMTADQKQVIFFEASPIVVSKESKQSAEAQKVLRSFYKKDVQQIFVDEAGIINTDNTKSSDPVNGSFVKEAADANKYQVMVRYYEATPSEVVTVATDELWKFFYKPTDTVLDDTLNTIQKVADSAFK